MAMIDVFIEEEFGKLESVILALKSYMITPILAIKFIAFN